MAPPLYLKKIMVTDTEAIVPENLTLKIEKTLNDANSGDFDAVNKKYVKELINSINIDADTLSKINNLISQVNTGSGNTISNLVTDVTNIKNNYATTASLDNYASKSSLTTYITETVLNNKGYLTSTDLASYATKTFIESDYTTTSNLERDYVNKISLESNYTTTANLAKDYASKLFLESDYASKSFASENYVTKTFALNNYATTASLNNYATDAELASTKALVNKLYLYFFHQNPNTVIVDIDGDNQISFAPLPS